MSAVELLIVAAAIAHLEDFASFEEADRSYDAGEWSDALRTTPRSVDAAVAVVDVYERAMLPGPTGSNGVTWEEWDAYCGAHDGFPYAPGTEMARLAAEGQS